MYLSTFSHKTYQINLSPSVQNNLGTTSLLNKGKQLLWLQMQPVLKQFQDGFPPSNLHKLCFKQAELIPFKMGFKLVQLALLSTQSKQEYSSS